MIDDARECCCGLWGVLHYSLVCKIGLLGAEAEAGGGAVMSDEVMSDE